jgi:hypothetical protein
MKNLEIIGFIGAALMVATLAMKTMIPLRVVGIAGSILQIAFAVSAGITPMLIQHGILLPLNAYRLYEQMRLVRKVRNASNKDLSMNCLMPFMTKRQVNAGQILFHKGDPAGEMFIVASGRLRLNKIAVDVLPGGVVGELGLLAPTSSAHKRSNVSKTPKSCGSVMIASSRFTSRIRALVSTCCVSQARAYFRISLSFTRLEHLNFASS